MVQTSPVARESERPGSQFPVLNVPVNLIRPEEGLARRRDRDGHRELQRSIEQFGVLTPITVRAAPDATGEYLLIKGQGRTLACRLLGIDTIPAIVVDDAYAESEKVQQFLVENVARLKMRPIDRALLVHRARLEGEETADIAKRFGLTATTVRRLFSQLDGASQREVAALRDGNVNLARHAVIARHAAADERPDVIAVVALSAVSTKDLEALFVALGWRKLVGLGDALTAPRIKLLGWACAALDAMPYGSTKERLRLLASELPLELDSQSTRSAAL